MIKEKLSSVFYHLPWRIIKTTLSIILAASLINSVSYILFVWLLPIYPFAYMQDNHMVHIGSTTTSLYFAMMAATKGVGNSLSSTWKAIRSQMIANFFGALFGVIMAMTLGEILGTTHALTIGIGVFFLFLVLKYLKLNEAFTLGGITFISVVVLSTNNYPPLVRGVDRFYSMGFGLLVSGLLNIIFLSPVISYPKVFDRLKEIQKLLCLKSDLSWNDKVQIDTEMGYLGKEIKVLLEDEKLEKRIFFWRRSVYDYQILNSTFKRSNIMVELEKLITQTSKQMHEVIYPMYEALKKDHYKNLFEGHDQLLIKKMLFEISTYLFQNREHHQHSEIVQILDFLNQYEQLLLEEQK